MPRIRVALIALLLASPAFGQNAPSALPPDATLLQVSAHGESHRKPDVATIQAGVVTRNVDASVAMRENAQRMSAVVAALKQAGVVERDIQTSSIGLQPQYTESSKQPPRISGYEARNSVTLRLRDMGRIGDVLAALVRLGANQIEGPSFAVDKPDEALDEARRAAVQQARDRAQLYADAAGLKVRRIVSISESGEVLGGSQKMTIGMIVSDRPNAAPVEAGENTLAVDLSVKFELGR
ncbi:MAG TPA: SIMPL domain-containing protein [Xanthomonadaceae bacterium]|jgi:hypothetical protein